MKTKQTYTYNLFTTHDGENKDNLQENEYK